MKTFGHDKNVQELLCSVALLLINKYWLKLWLGVIYATCHSLTNPVMIQSKTGKILHKQNWFRIWLGIEHIDFSARLQYLHC